MTGTALADDIAARLAAAGCVFATEEAEELVASAPDAATALAWAGRREAGEPFAWVVGRVTFCGATVGVDPGVYVPRRQTEELARRAAAALPGGGRAVDLCTGAGAVAAHLGAAVPGSRVVGTDLDPGAARVARRNGVAVVVGDLDRGLRSGAFHVVTAVPPYVPSADVALLPADVRGFEPRLALDGGGDGLGVARRVVAAAARLLVPGGWLFVELGGDQDRGLAPTLAGRGFDPVEAWRDEEGDLRGVAARLAPGRRSAR